PPGRAGVQRLSLLADRRRGGQLALPGGADGRRLVGPPLPRGRPQPDRADGSFQEGRRPDRPGDAGAGRPGGPGRLLRGPPPGPNLAPAGPDPGVLRRALAAGVGGRSREGGRGVGTTGPRVSRSAGPETGGWIMSEGGG